MEKLRRQRSKKFHATPVDLERKLAAYITQTGAEQIKRRRKAGLSVYYVKDGRIIEVRPDQTEIEVKEIPTRWVTVAENKRSIVLK